MILLTTDPAVIIQTITDYPYIGAAAVFMLCGLGLPIPEEIVLLAAGFVCAKFPDKAQLLPMMGWCAAAIVAGDTIPFLLGKIFGVRLLRLRWLRYFITKRRLAMFDHWFRRRGDLVIVISRFMPGLRVVAFFTAGAMKMRWTRFLLLDGLGIALIVPLLTWLGYRSAGFIEEAFTAVQSFERGLLWGIIIAVLLLTGWLWWRRIRRARQHSRDLKETFVQPRTPVDGNSPENSRDGDDETPATDGPRAISPPADAAQEADEQDQAPQT